jgi:hypothetical protein
MNGGRHKSSLAAMEMVMVGFNNDGSNDYYKNMFFLKIILLKNTQNDRCKKNHLVNLDDSIWVHCCD